MHTEKRIVKHVIHNANIYHACSDSAPRVEHAEREVDQGEDAEEEDHRYEHAVAVVLVRLKVHARVVAEMWQRR